ncbi:hypothetical protein [Agrobacterium tumefaciens]|uniref:hypothetical protein n=1 Tax=Agrobacterium tumefaciens TaxID=358 RepID=UPI0019691159|nr:hypothetical protein [Agrobacterium tumefaciens]
MEPTITSKRPAVQACAEGNVRFRFRRNAFKLRRIDAGATASGVWGVATLRRPLSKTE